MSLREIRLRCPSGRSRILVGPCLDRLPGLADPAKTLVVTDGPAREALGPALAAYRVLEIGRGEGAKSLATVESVYRELLGLEADRGWTLVGAGGGLVCDLAGFAAATFMRGIRAGLLPTTLLAQVDASVGGKNGVNVGGYKNVAGVFRQPEFVLCDPAPLLGLPEREYRQGLAEAVKHAVIASEGYFRFLEAGIGAAAGRDGAFLGELVRRSVMIKAAIVSRDERESGPRAALNLGHTLGHGIEAVLGLPHGEAVAVGMAAACSLAAGRGLLDRAAEARVRRLIEALGLPTGLSGALPEGLPEGAASRIVDALRRDKKRDGDALRFVLPERIGRVRIERIGFGELAGAVEEMTR